MAFLFVLKLLFIDIAVRRHLSNTIILIMQICLEEGRRHGMVTLEGIARKRNVSGSSRIKCTKRIISNINRYRKGWEL